MIHDIITACASGLDLLTVYLLFVGYSQKEVAEMIGSDPAIVCRKVKAIRKRMEGSETK